MLKLFKKLNISFIDLLVILVFFLLAGFFYFGFFHPAPHILEGSAVKYLIIAIKVLIPLITFGIIYLYIDFRRKKISAGSLLLLFITIVMFSLIVYPLLNYFYEKKSQKYYDEYHSFLQRTPAMLSSIDTADYNIFCLGGSTTEWGDNQGRFWPTMLESELKREYELNRLKVFNLGKAWYTAQHSLINYLQNLHHYKPKVILFMHAINDAWVNVDFSRFSNGRFREDYGHYLGPAAYVVKYPSLAAYIVDSFNLLWYADNLVEIESENFPGIISFERNLNLIIEISRIHNTKVVLITEPTIYKESMTAVELESLEMYNQEAVGEGKKWTYITAFKALNMYNDKIREVATKQQVLLIDLEKAIPKSLEYFRDDVHYQDKAFDLISKFISENMKPLLVPNSIK